MWLGVVNKHMYTLTVKQGAVGSTPPHQWLLDHSLTRKLDTSQYPTVRTYMMKFEIIINTKVYQWRTFHQINKNPPINEPSYPIVSIVHHNGSRLHYTNKYVQIVSTTTSSKAEHP